MEFNTAEIAEEVGKTYAGVTINDATVGSFELYSSVRIAPDRRKMINRLSKELAAMEDRAKEDPSFELDPEVTDAKQVDALALRCSDATRFRTWLASFPENDVLAVVRTLFDKLNEIDQGNSAAQ